jgi:phosphodiesterase/alkaline phosphatase D-like protein
MMSELVMSGVGRGLGTCSRWLCCGCVTRVVWLALAALLFCAGGAQAVTGHGFVWGVGEAPPGTGLAGPVSVAVDGVSGRVFVGDGLAGYVDVFDGSGVFVGRFGGGLARPVGVGVDDGSGDVFVADGFAEGVDVYAPDGSGTFMLLSRWWGTRVPGGEFGVVAGVAVDNGGGPFAGDVFVLESRTARGGPAAVDVFEPGVNGSEGVLVARWSSSKLESPGGIAVEPESDRVLVADGVVGAVWVFGAEGAYVGKLNGKGSPFGTFVKGPVGAGDVAGVGVDGASGSVLVAEAERGVVSEYGFEGGEWKWQGWITTTPEGDLGEPRGVAAGGAGSVFVADAGLGMVDRFGAGVVVPNATTEKVKKLGEGLTRTSAVLLGSINGEGELAKYRFEYGATRALGSETPVQASGSGVQAVAANINHLEAGQGYFYRIVGENENGADYGRIERFETLPAVTGLETGVAIGVGTGGAVLSGVLKREGLRTQYYFQYGTTTAYGTRAPEPAAVVPPATEEKEEKQLQTMEAGVSGLEANAIYHYRLVAENEYGRTYGQDQTLTTSGPPVILMAPVSELGQTGARVNANINPEKSETTFVVRYGEMKPNEKQTSPVSVGSSSTTQAVSVVLGGLRVGTTYYYQIVAANGPGTTTSPIETFGTVASAPVDAAWVSDIKSGEAVLHASVNPMGNDTHVYFQYGTESCQNDSQACVRTPVPPGTDIAAGGQDVSVAATASGLEPATTYNYRVIASNGLGVTEGPERAFSTQAEGGLVLPDGRAWEMVTPADKQGAPVEALTREGGIILASKNGNGLSYVVNGAQGEEVEGNRSPEMQQVLATRTESGWTSQDIATPNSIAKGIAPGNAPEYQFFTPELSVALVEPPGTGAEPPLVERVTQNTMYLRDNKTGTYVPVVSNANTPPGTHFDGGVHFETATPDLSHVVFGSSVALTGAGSTAGLYEWSGGQLRFVSVMPGGKPARAPDLGYYGAVLATAVSNDGSRVFWTTREDLGTRGGHLYLRDSVRGETVKLDAAQGVVEAEKGSAEFQGASSDGSRVFFIDRQRLTVDSTAEPGQGVGEPDLYECQIVETGGRLACELHDLTVDQGAHANVQGLVLGISEDGTRVFLVARGVLAANTNGNGEAAVAGKNNLYELSYDGTEWSRVFIATLSKEDSPEWEGNQIANTAYVTARVSPNGRYFAFMSQAPITGYENVDANPAANGARDEEVFLYDTVAGSLRCVSCNPDGARPEGVLDHETAGEGLGLVVDRRLVWGREGNEHWLAGNIPGWTSQTLVSALYQSRYLSDDGRLFFNSPDGLVPAAKNHKEDVYEYEPSGVGGCQSGTGGCVALVSGGESERESAFLEATPDGSSVFFFTEAQLLPGQDTDTAFDIYDARECFASSPCLSPPPGREAPCGETETCRPAEPSQPLPNGPAGTASFTGPSTSITPAHVPSTSGGGEVRGKKASKRITRAQKFKHGLKACRKHHAHSRRKRERCERSVRKRYAEHYNKQHTKKKRKLGAQTSSVSRGTGRTSGR